MFLFQSQFRNNNKKNVFFITQINLAKLNLVSKTIDYIGDAQTLEKSVWAIKNGHSRETGNIGYTRHKTMTNTIKKNTTR